MSSAGSASGLARRAAIGLLLAAGLLCALSQAQPPPPPGAPPQPPGQGAPPGASQPGQPGGPPAPGPPGAAGAGHNYIGEIDPYLKYQTGVKVRVSQLEVGAFPVVRAFVSVLDQNGALIKTLRAENFTVQENGTGVAEVRFANREQLDLPLSIMIIVDISGSMEPSIQLEKDAVRQFVGQLAERDRAGLITFSDAALPQVPIGTDHEEVLRRVDQMVAFGQTALWDAIYLGMEQLLQDPTPARRAMIVLTDGLDNRSLETPQTILQYYDENALKKNQGFSVYTLGLGEDIDRGSLSAVALHTSGQYVDSPTADDLARVYQDILSQIQSEYLLEYDSPITSTPGQIIDVSVGLTGVQGFEPGKYTYRSPGLSKALARALWPGLITIIALLIILILATIYKLTRRVWLTVMLTPLEGKDYVIGLHGADIGTLESCQIRVRHDPAMLDRHASLVETADGYLLSAIDPQSPVVMHGSLLARKLLRHGDRFTLGTTRFVFNEKALRAGEGEALPAEFLTAAPAPQITEAAQAAGKPEPQRQPPKALVGLSGPYAGQRFTLAQGDNVIGRSEGSIVLGADGQVSRRHCVIVLALHGATAADLGSTNGTRLNGAPLQPGLAQPAHAGDELALGAGAYRLE